MNLFNQSLDTTKLFKTESTHLLMTHLRITLIFVACFMLCGCMAGLQKQLSPQDPDINPAQTSAANPPAPEFTYDIQTDDLSGESVAQPSLPGSLSEPFKHNLPVTHNLPGTQQTLVDSQPVLDRALDFCQVAQDFWEKGELENALQALDQAYSLIINVDTNDIPNQQKEDLRFLISKRILEIYASRNIVVNGNHKAIPITINKHVQAEINRFAPGGRDHKFFLQSYQRSGLFRAHIEKELKEAGLPESLVWLPLIESGFKTGALSKARALGLWQFIPSTGYKFGLNRDLYIDERLDPYKSTKAAIAYLKELHQIFGDWTTALAAYNCGEGRVLRLIRSQNVNYLDNFWDLYERLPWETARYVPKFLATLHIINNPETYGLDKVAVYSPREFETIEVSKQVYLKNIAKTIDAPASELIKLNPELRYKLLPPKPYTLRVPPGAGETLLANIDNIPVSTPPRKSFVYHRVRKGQTLSTIARKYRTSVPAIARANNINRRNYIVAGKLLKIPQRGTVYTSKKYRPVNKNATSHIVRSGDSLWIIAKRYGTTTKTIQDLNGLTNTNLHKGQLLKLPGFKARVAPDQDLKVYQVKSGDSPYTIAIKHKMPLNQLLNINHLTKNSTIFPGQQLFVQ